MAKIDSLDFAEYVDQSKTVLASTLKNKFNKNISDSSSLAELVAEVRNIPLKESTLNTIYWPEGDIDIRELLNNDTYKDCQCAAGYVLYDCGDNSYNSQYEQVPLPANSVAIFSDGVLIDNRDNTKTIYREIPWDILQDIPHPSGLFNLRYVLVFYYDTISRISYPHCTKTVILKNFNLDVLDIYEQGNSLSVSSSLIYLKNCVINHIMYNRGISISVEDIILDSSTLNDVSGLAGSNIYHERLNARNISITSSSLYAFSTNWILTEFNNLNNPASSDQIYDTVNGIHQTAVFSERSNLKSSYRLSRIAPYTTIISYGEVSFNDTATSSGPTAIEFTLDLRNASQINISLLRPIMGSTSGPFNTKVVNILTPTGKIDFNLNLKMSTSSSYQYAILSLKCLKNIFNQLADLTISGETRTFTIGEYAIRLLPEEVVAAQLKGWTIS